MVERTAVFPAGRHSLYAEHRYSAAIRSGDLLFVSGQVGSREDGTPEPDFQQQVRLSDERLRVEEEAPDEQAAAVDRDLEDAVPDRLHLAGRELSLAVLAHCRHEPAATDLVSDVRDLVTD